MGADGFAVFDTALGTCGVAWSADGRIVGSQLPEGTAEQTAARMRERFPDAVAAGSAPPSVRRAIDGVVALLSGDHVDLSDVDVDMSSVPEFHARVYTAARGVRPGRTSTYGQIALGLGSAGSARAVGQALARNPFAPIVPCHRIMASGRRLGGFSAAGGQDTKRRLLFIEGALAEQQSLF